MRCQVCGGSDPDELRPAVFVRPALVELIRGDTGRWDEEGWICAADLQQYRNRYVRELLRDEKGEITSLETEVLRSLQEHEILARNPDIGFDSQLTTGQRLADRLADFGGSWVFIVSFIAVVGLWMLVNSWLLGARPFDPYPYILLNLMLSCLAALQAPVIMMSQNRQEDRDRQRAMHDYQVNLKAELEIRHLHQKVDHILSHQWDRLAEIQEIQLELMNELRGRR